MKEEFKSRLFSYVIKLIKFLGSLSKDIVTREIISQLMRSGTSIGANYFEAQSASFRKDYINYFTHSLKSANETKFWLNVCLESKLVPEEKILDCKWLLCETNELARIFASSIVTMKKQK